MREVIAAQPDAAVPLSLHYSQVAFPQLVERFEAIPIPDTPEADRELYEAQAQLPEDLTGDEGHDEMVDSIVHLFLNGSNANLNASVSTLSESDFEGLEVSDVESVPASESVFDSEDDFLSDDDAMGCGMEDDDDEDWMGGAIVPSACHRQEADWFPE
uniref:Uncharacterized protein n=1 Tax=Mycena chlorophos TaxID=658473 RepID=A0ABQ0L7X8_MYCCL|nr:predicted protein [Mycena chlorophos]